MRRPAVVFGILCAVVLVAYWPSFGGFAVYEDVHWISEILTPITLRPTWDLAHWSLSLNAFLGGTTPWGYHLLNVGIHCVNGWLVFVLARRIFARVLLHEQRADLMGLCVVTATALKNVDRGSEEQAVVPALLAAAVFLLHPIQTEAVAYLTGRWDLVSTLLVLLALTTRGWWSLPFAILAMTTKTSAIVVLPLLWWLGDTAQSVLPVALGAGLVIGDVLWKDTFGRVPYLFMSPYGPVEYAARQAAALWRMLALVVVPWGQTIDHDWGSVPLWAVVLAIPALIGAGVEVYKRRSAQPILWLSACWILICVAPRFAVRPSEFLSEHQMYLSSVGVALLVGWWGRS